jgi:FtsP/CotA-like multicopper oxidase with cupredoxin domain
LVVSAWHIIVTMRQGATRRSFLGRGAAGVAAAATGGMLYSHSRAHAQHVDVRLFVNDGVLALPRGRSLYHWSFGDTPDAPSMPGRVIRAVEGDTITVSVTNTLDEPHSFAIAGVADSGPIAPGATATVSFDAPRAGTYVYGDALNSPVNRVLGLHGALVVMPAGAADVPFVGGPRFVRQFVWVFSCLDPRWSERARSGRAIDPGSFEPRVFMINGRFGDFSSKARDTAPHGRVGEPALIRMINAGLTVKSIHFHGNHVRVLTRNGAPPVVPMNKDTVFVDRGDVVDVLLPFNAPPDAYPPVRTSTYPVHDHEEMTQTLHGGLYPNGLLTDWELEG